MRPVILGPSEGVVRRTIGFRKEVVEDSAEQEPFSVVGGSFLPPEKSMERDWADPACRMRYRQTPRARMR